MERHVAFSFSTLSIRLFLTLSHLVSLCPHLALRSLQVTSHRPGTKYCTKQELNEIILCGLSKIIPAAVVCGASSRQRQSGQSWYIGYTRIYS
ncbi:hypothetical protein E2C01_040727 [Portunus trituberculatus]|uniref:Secreted protein n=1 Tax=Portunus trituberculatus TaxID=210409 RepID=A0A5B7FPJ3_PORTR|nr:hypothetical protein [Portunus trituberculatus]